MLEQVCSDHGQSASYSGGRSPLEGKLKHTLREFGNIVLGVFTPVLAKHTKSFDLIDPLSSVWIINIPVHRAPQQNRRQCLLFLEQSTDQPACDGGHSHIVRNGIPFQPRLANKIGRNPGE